MKEIIRAESIGFSYGGAEVLRGIDMPVGRGKWVGLLGANGAGKSTLLKMVSGILNPKSGRVFYKGENIKNLDRREIAKRIAYVPQSANFGFPFTVAEVAVMGRAPYFGKLEFERHADREIALGALEAVRIRHLENRLITEISGGEKQLVSLARALAQEPEVMVLDEPMVSLDLKHRTEVMKLLMRLKAEKNVSIISATHDIFAGLFHFDEIIMLKDGKIFAAGNTEEVMREEIFSDVYGIDVNIKKENGRISVLPAI